MTAVANQSKGCTGCILAFGAVAFALIGIVWLGETVRQVSKPKADEKSVSVGDHIGRSLPAPDPFSINSVVYSYQPDPKKTIVVCATNFECAHELLVKEREANYNAAKSLMEQILQKPFTPVETIEGKLHLYILDQQEKGKLLFIPSGVKMRILEKRQENEVSGHNINYCEILEPNDKGLKIYIREVYLRPPQN